MRTLLLAACAAALLPAAAGAQQPPVPKPQIVVTGEGEAAAAPDMAVVTMAVLREGETARSALTASNQGMREVLGALRGAGIAERDIQTSGLSIQPRYGQPGRPQPGQPPVYDPKITGYSVSNHVTVTSPGPQGPGFSPHEKSFLLPAAYAARSAGQPRRSSG